MEPLLATVAACLERHGLPCDSSLAVACSGGADSIALAHLVARLAGGARPVLVHVDHGLRPDSAADGEAVRALAARLDLGFAIERTPVERRGSLEDAARRARYEAFDRLADAGRLRAILLAHTADDQAETVLHRIVRGTGPTGLAAMAERRGRYLRPLLAAARADLAAYGARHGLAAIDDSMNRDERFARVRLRRTVLPALVAENPRAVDALVRLARQAAETREVIDAAARALLAPLDLAALAVAPIAAAPAAIAKRALALAADTAGIGPLAAEHLDALHALALAPRAGSRQLSLPGGVALREYDSLRLEGGTISPPPPRPIAAPAGFEVRRWRPGDRMRPARLRGRSRKLADLYTDLRVPRAARPSARVVVDGSGVIVWAEHVGPSWNCPPQLSLTVGCVVASN